MTYRRLMQLRCRVDLDQIREVGPDGAHMFSSPLWVAIFEDSFI